MVDIEIDGKPIMVGIPAAGKRKRKQDDNATPKTVVDATPPWWKCTPLPLPPLLSCLATIARADPIKHAVRRADP